VQSVPGPLRRIAATAPGKESTTMPEASEEKPLAERPCEPCRGGVPPLKDSAIRKLLAQLGGDWKVVNHHRLEKRYSFKDFREALDFTNNVGEAAEKVNHHPDLSLGWGFVKVTLSTHKVHGLTEADFVLAAQIEALFQKRNEKAGDCPNACAAGAK
jgi:4a-hydroxytetrahydrobiopterin dehydratase